MDDMVILYLLLFELNCIDTIYKSAFKFYLKKKKMIQMNEEKGLMKLKHPSEVDHLQ